MYEAVVLHVIIDQISFGPINTTSSKCNQIFMFDIRQCSYLRYEFSLSTHRFNFNWKNLHSHYRTILQPTLQSWTKNATLALPRKGKGGGIIDMEAKERIFYLVHTTKATFSNLVRGREVLGGNFEFIRRE